MFGVPLGEKFLFIYGGCGSGQSVRADWFFLHVEELRCRQVGGQADPPPAWEGCWEAMPRLVLGARPPLPAFLLAPEFACCGLGLSGGRRGAPGRCPLLLASFWAYGGGEVREAEALASIPLSPSLPPQIPVEGPLPAGRHSHSACGWADGALIAGGLDAAEQALGSVLHLKPSGRGFQWCPVETCPPLTPRQVMGVCGSHLFPCCLVSTMWLRPHGWKAAIL